MKKTIIIFDNLFKKKYIVISNLKILNEINIKKNIFKIIKINQSIKSLKLFKKEKNENIKNNIKFLKKYDKI